jgi:hypothetical protein
MILYHGTSKKRLQRILADNCLKANTVIDPSVCMSSRYEPALYWANMSAWTDTSSPVIIRFEAMTLLDNWYSLIPYSDPVWGEKRCDWEREVRTNEDIYPLYSRGLTGLGSIQA